MELASLIPVEVCSLAAVSSFSDSWLCHSTEVFSLRLAQYRGLT